MKQQAPRLGMRRKGQSFWRKLLRSLMKERRWGFDRRQRVDMGPWPERNAWGMPVIVPSSEASEDAPASAPAEHT